MERRKKSEKKKRRTGIHPNIKEYIQLKYMCHKFNYRSKNTLI